MRQINARPGYKMARNVVRKLHKGAESVTWHGEKPRMTKYSAKVIAEEFVNETYPFDAIVVKFVANYPDGHDQMWLLKRGDKADWFPLDTK